MSRSVKATVTLLLGLLIAYGSNKESMAQTYGLGSPTNEKEIAPWNIDVGPDGVGLPAGQGTSQTGEPVFLDKCAACHGVFGEGVGRFRALIGEKSSLTSDRPVKTVGSYWPYATTLWDYINRAMPFGNAQSLSADEVYAVTAYILAMNDIITEDEVMNAETLPKVKMPNRDGFVFATGPDIKVDACMKNCVDKVTITSRATGNNDAPANTEQDR